MHLAFILTAAIYFSLAFPINIAKAGLDPKEDFNKFTTYYYLNPQPEKIPLTLKGYLLSIPFENDRRKEELTPVSYLFGKVAKLEPSLIPEYLKIFEDTTHACRVFLLTVFQICANEQVVGYLRSKLDDNDFANERNAVKDCLSKRIPINFDPLSREVADASDLDYLWAEFFVTGKREPIAKIIDVLGWEDRFNSKLRNWFSSAHTKEEIRSLNAMLNASNIIVDLERNEINGGSDMDCIYTASLSGDRANNQKFKDDIQIRKALQISREDLLYMLTKGAAMWSLQSNAQQHPRVLEYCKQEFIFRNDKSKIELAIILELASKGTIELAPAGQKEVFTLQLKNE